MRGCLFQPYAELVAVPWRADLEQRNRSRRFPGRLVFCYGHRRLFRSYGRVVADEPPTPGP